MSSVYCWNNSNYHNRGHLSFYHELTPGASYIASLYWSSGPDRRGTFSRTSQGLTKSCNRRIEWWWVIQCNVIDIPLVHTSQKCVLTLIFWLLAELLWRFLSSDSMFGLVVFDDRIGMYNLYCDKPHVRYVRVFETGPCPIALQEMIQHEDAFVRVSWISLR